MLKDLFSQTIRVGLSSVEMKDLSSPDDSESSAKIQVYDLVSFSKSEKLLRVEFTREVSFNPPDVFSLSVTYFVEHFLKVPGSLNDFADGQIRREIYNDIDYFSQQSQGYALRLSLIIGQLTSSFGGPPLMLPPKLEIEPVEHEE